MTKTFKIGEYCVGGIIKAKKDGDTNYVEVLDWNTKNVLFAKRCRDINEMRWFLDEMTSSYYADKVVDFLEGKR